ncbi:MAG: L-lactate MFS transporter [Promethearchaeota archaeon]
MMMQDRLVKNRGIVVIGALLIQLALGTIYCWGVLTTFISGGLFLAEPTYITVYIFGIGLLSFAITMIFAGKLQQQIGPMKVAIIGGLLIGIGVILSAFMTNNFAGLLITYGVLFGAGIGFAYVCPIACAAKWFPDKKGFINGIAVAGFGAGSFIFNYAIKAFAAISVPTMFILLGIIYLAMIIVGAITLVNPPEGWVPEGWVPPPPSEESGVSGLVFNRKEIIKLPQFWMLWSMFLLSAACGLMTIGSYKVFAEGENIIGDLILVGSLAALFNGAGRIVWGKLSDIIAYKRSMMIMFIVQAILMLTYAMTSASYVIFLLWTCLIYFCFGGNFSMFPTATSDLFGNKNLGENYSIVFTAYGIAGFIGATMVLTFITLFGGYTTLFIVMGIMSLAAAGIAFVLKPPKK